ncbi:hypothetical protein PTKIN_Ptkin05aG0144000 [Pterospermum kingtungense]
MDQFTVKQQQLAYAKVCIVLDATKDIPKFVRVKMRNGVLISVRVEAPWCGLPSKAKKKDVIVTLLTKSLNEIVEKEPEIPSNCSCTPILKNTLFGAFRIQDATIRSLEKGSTSIGSCFVVLEDE